jgi:hypothetical protein
MNTTDTTFPVGTINTSTPSRVRRRTMIAIGAAATIVIAASSAAVQGSRDETTRPTPPTPALSDYDQLRDLANRGVIPRQALHPAPMSREDLRSLVDRGVVPRQALHPAPMTDAQLQDLANRGVIPRQSLEPAPTTTPADGGHP